MKPGDNTGLCLVSANDGPRYMRPYYDSLPQPVRERISRSDFNLCAACIHDQYRLRKDINWTMKYISEMERMIREGERFTLLCVTASV